MTKTKSYKAAVVTAVLGLTSIFIVFISKSAYPDMLFKILVPLGLLLVFASVALLFMSYIVSIKSAAKNKNYVMAAILLMAFIITVIRFLLNAFF